MGRIAKKTVSDTGVHFGFVDGEELHIGLGDLSDEIIHKLAIHGLSQKVGDSYAGAESIEEARGLASAVIKNLKAGLWGAKVQRGGKIIEALSRATGQDFETCLAKWQGMDKDEQAALRKHPQVKKALAEIEAERAAKLAETAEEAEDDLASLLG